MTRARSSLYFTVVLGITIYYHKSPMPQDTAIRTRQVMTVSLPPEMLRQVERAMKAENRTRSELIREALRVYFHAPIRYYTPTLAERRAIEQGRAAIRRGDFYTLDEFRAHLADQDPKARAQKRGSSAAKRARASRARARRNDH